MKNIILITALMVSFSGLAQSNYLKIKKRMSFSIENWEYKNVCSAIIDIVEDYDCHKFIDRKFLIKNKEEELVILIKKNHKIIVQYKSIITSGELGRKYDKIVKVFNE